MIAAVRTPSDKRRAEIAELSGNGLSKGEAEIVELETLLRLLERLNDAQMLLLYRYGGFRGTMGDPDAAAFESLHPQVFNVDPPTFGSAEAERRRWTMREAYVGELVAMGLLEDVEGIAKSQGHRRVRITGLGRLLLESVGCEVKT